MRLTERIDQNTIKIIDLRKNTWKIPENNVPLQSDFKRLTIWQHQSELFLPFKVKRQGSL